MNLKYKNFKNLEIFEINNYQMLLFENGSFIINKTSLKFSIYFFPFGGYIYGNFYNFKFQDFCKIVYPNGFEEFCNLKDGIKIGESFLYTDNNLFKLTYDKGIIKNKKIVNLNSENLFKNKKQNLINKLNFILESKNINVNYEDKFIKFLLKDDDYLGISYKNEYMLGIFFKNNFKGKIIKKNKDILIGEFEDLYPINDYISYNYKNKIWILNEIMFNNKKSLNNDNNFKIPKKVKDFLDFKYFNLNNAKDYYNINPILFNLKELDHYKNLFNIDNINFFEKFNKEINNLDVAQNQNILEKNDLNTEKNNNFDTEKNNNFDINNSSNYKKSYYIENFKIIENNDKQLIKNKNNKKNQKKNKKNKITIKNLNKSIENSLIKSNLQNTYSLIKTNANSETKFKNEMNKDIKNLNQKINTLYKNLKYKNPKMSKFKNIFYEKDYEEEIRNLKNVKYLNVNDLKVSYTNLNYNN